MYPESFRVSPLGESELLIERDFHAPRELVFDALTRPEIVRRWLLGPDGWSMPVCEIDLRVGGAYRYQWRHDASGRVMGMGGTFLEVVRPARLVATEKFDEAWYAGEAIDTTELTQRGEVTAMRLVVRYQSAEARSTAMQSGMEQGMAIGYSRLETLLAGE